MATAPISNPIITRAETFIAQGTSALTTLTNKWFAKKEVKEEIVSDRLQKRRNSIIHSYTSEDMKKNVDQFGKELDTSRFRLALDKFEKAQEDLNSAESEESLSARRIKMSSAHEVLKTEFKQLNIHCIREKRLSEAKEKAIKQSMIDKALKVKEYLGESKEMFHLEQTMETDPELAEALLNARLVIITNTIH